MPFHGQLLNVARWLLYSFSTATRQPTKNQKEIPMFLKMLTLSSLIAAAFALITG
jgi:hypothetical protein